MSQIKTKFIANNAVDDTKVRLRNDQPFRSRNAADSGDVDILKINSADKLFLALMPHFQGGSEFSLNNAFVAANALSDVDLTNAGTVFDGYTAVDGDLILLAAQALPEQNGVYTFHDNFPSDNTLTRITAWGTAEQFQPGREVYVFQGNTYAGTTWKVITSPSVLDTDPISLQLSASNPEFATEAKPKQAVRVASTANGALATAFEAGDTVDGVVLADGDRLLLKDQTASEENGIYIVQASGAPLRASDFDSVLDIPGSYTPAEFGTVNAGKLFVCQSTPAVLDSDPIVFVSASSTAYTGGDGITVTGFSIDVDLKAISGLKFTADELETSLEASSPSLEVNGSNELAVKAAGITGTHLNTSVAGAGLSGGGGAALSVNVDASTIEINTDTLRVKAAGITGTELATSVAGAGLAGGGGSALSVNVDASTIEINVDTLRVKAAGITGTELAASVAGSGLAGGGGSALSVNVDNSTIKISADTLEGLKVIEEVIDLSGTDISNKYYDLAHAAFGASDSVNSVSVSVVSGPTQQKGLDFTIDLDGGVASVTRINWSGLGFDGLLDATDFLVVNYSYLT